MAADDEKLDAGVATFNENSRDTDSTTSLEEQYGVSEKKLLRKLDRILLPGVTILYLLSFLDRSNVANARIEGLATDLKITGDEYLTGLTLFFVGYISLEVPWNAVLRLTSPKLWLPTVTLVWGIVSTLQGIVQNKAGFFSVRFFLGVAEGGLFPGVVFYLSMWYKRRERQYRVAMFFSAAALAGAFGGILAYGIAHMNGVAGYAGWRWIFIIEGLLTVVVAALGYLFIYNYPNTAGFLSADEKRYIALRLKADSDATNNEGFTWLNVLNALKDYKLWLYCLCYHTLSLPLYTLSLFLPTIIKSLGYSAAAAQLLTVPPYALAFLTCVGLAALSERLRVRWIFVVCTSALSIVGYIMLLANTNPTKHPGVSYAAVFLAAAGIYPGVAIVLSFPAINVSGQTKRATANALQITIGNLGAVIGTQLYRSEDTPRFILGHSFALGYLVANIFVVGITKLALERENRRKDEALAALQTGAAATDGAGSADRGPASLADQWNGDEDLRWRFDI